MKSNGRKNPNSEALIQQLVAEWQEARTRYHKWIDAHKEVFAKSQDLQALMDQLADQVRGLAPQLPFTNAQGTFQFGDGFKVTRSRKPQPCSAALLCDVPVRELLALKLVDPPAGGTLSKLIAAQKVPPEWSVYLPAAVEYKYSVSTGDSNK